VCGVVWANPWVELNALRLKDVPRLLQSVGHHRSATVHLIVETITGKDGARAAAKASQNVTAGNVVYKIPEKMVREVVGNRVQIYGLHDVSAALSIASSKEKCGDHVLLALGIVHERRNPESRIKQ